jgi:8-oxo-dGTP pyrophosphatase MutT (NUDIX family)
MWQDAPADASTETRDCWTADFDEGKKECPSVLLESQRNRRIIAEPASPRNEDLPGKPDRATARGPTWRLSTSTGPKIAAMPPNALHPSTPLSAENLYAVLRDHAQEAPPALSRTLHIAGSACGHATLAACDALRDHPAVRLDADALHIGAGMAPGPALNGVLASTARALREADCLRGWRDELLDITAPDGTHLGVIERAAVRPLGILTRAVHLNAWTPDGLLWVARRALDKATDPGMWDTLVGGLVAAGETLDIALIRECDEEAGLSAGDIRGRSDLRTVLRMHRRLPEGYQVEDLLVSRCVLDAAVQPRNRDGEVMEIATVSAPQALAMVAAGEFTLEAALVVVDDIAAQAGQR